MESPETEAAATKTTTAIVAIQNASTAGSPQVHDSPLFSYISNLSPIQPVKAAHVAQGLLELSSPPLVFMSPRINPAREISLKRPPLPQRKNAEVSSYISESSAALIAESKEVSEMKFKDTLQTFSSPVCVDEYLAGPLTMASSEQTPGEIIYDSRKTECVQIGAKIHSVEFLDVEPDIPVCNDSRRKHSEHSLNDCGAPIPDGCVGNAMLHHDDDLEVSQEQRGFLRRCLIFVDGHQNSETDKPFFQNPLNTSPPVSNSPSCPIDLEVVDSNHDDLTATSTDKPEIEMFPSQIKEPSSFSLSKPSCIGLHLNSIVNSLPMGCTASAKLKFKSVENNILSVQRLKPESDTNINSLEYKRKICSEHAPNFLELEQMSPNTKPKMSPDTNDEVACKMCNCKKTKCLKLYCDCFAAGIYCAEICSCQGCFNRPEFEKTVMETRQQIESRNPIAFGPKIATTPPNTGEDGSLKKTSSLKHKKGCNCKKSTCLKKYCECFQANVGCSDGCRCVGCKNIYGMKEDYVFTRVVRHEVTDEVYESVTESRARFKNTERTCDPQSLNPSTPLFDHSDHRKEGSRRCWQPSPESDAVVEKRHSMTVESREMIPVTDQFTPELWKQSSFPFPSSTGSLRWRSSPITPSPHDGAFVVESSEEKERETVAKKMVEIRSPNQKRISPPRNKQGTMSGRKFILRSVTSPIRPFLERDCTNSSKKISE